MKRKLLYRIIVTILCLCLIACQTTQINGPPDSFVNSSDGIPIYYTKTGTTNTTLLFIHCWGCNSNYWKPQIEEFNKTHQVISLDLAGHGLSGANRNKFTIELFADDVIAVIEKLDLSNVILVGHSLGAVAAIEAALKLPHVISGIIAVDTFETEYKWPKASEITQAMIPFQKNFYKTTYPKIKDRFTPQADKSLIYHISKDIALAPPDIGRDSLENLYQWIANSYQNTRMQMTVPLILINSRRNNISTTSAEKILYIPFVGHYIPQEAPKRFNTSLYQAIGLLAAKK
jgi:pimeloyl-ACP methyl ester carboxylesterase